MVQITQHLFLEAAWATAWPLNPDLYTAWPPHPYNGDRKLLVAGKWAEGFKGHRGQAQNDAPNRTAAKKVVVFPIQTIRPQYRSAIWLTDYSNNCCHNELVWRGEKVGGVLATIFLPGPSQACVTGQCTSVHEWTRFQVKYIARPSDMKF